MATMQMNTGISEKDRAKIAGGLARLLADTYTVYLKTHNFHWNVEGPMFQTDRKSTRLNSSHSS